MTEVLDLVDHLRQYYDGDNERDEATDHHLDGLARRGAQHAEAHEDDVQDTHLADTADKGGYVDGLHDVQLQEAPKDILEVLEYVLGLVLDLAERNAHQIPHRGLEICGGTRRRCLG